MHERQLHGVADLLDLRAEAPDVRVVDVRDLFEHEFLDLGLRNALDGETGPAVHQQRIAGPQSLAAQWVREVHHLLLVGVRDDQGPRPSLEDLLEHHDVTALFETGDLDDVHRLVEHDLLARDQS